MKGIILAGGAGTRLLPLTKVTNKHLLPVGREPMIYHPVRKLARAGIRDILVVTGCEHVGDVVGVLGGGEDFGCDFTYRVQVRAGGIAEALGLAKSFARGDKVCVLLGDNIFQDPLGPYAEHFERQGAGARVALKQVPDPQRYGVAEVEADAPIRVMEIGSMHPAEVVPARPRKILRIAEKPARPTSDYAVTGIYFYDEQVFDVISALKPSGRGELEITDVNNAYIDRGLMQFDVLSGYWTDAGTHESLRLANELELARAPEPPHLARSR